MQTNAIQRLAAICALAFAPVALADVGMAAGNLAPQETGSGGVATIEVDGVVRADRLAYKQFSNGFRLRAGNVLARARDGSGRELTTRTFALRDGYDYVLLLTGNGQAAPYQLKLAVDHNYPIHAGEWTDQDIHAAPIATSTGLRRFNTRVSCGGGRTDLGAFEYGDGTLDNGRSYHNSHRGFAGNGDDQPCIFRLLDPGSTAPVVETVFQPETGVRYRFFAVGDGVRQPLEALVWLQRREPTVATVAPSAGMEGLWLDPANPGAGVSIAYDPDALQQNLITAVIYGFDETGRATWNFLQSETGLVRGVGIFEYAGGSPAGNRGTVRYRLTTGGTLEFHSCSTATLTLRLPSEPLFPAGTAFGQLEPPRDAIRLVRVLPAGSACSNSANFG
ncbi:MAG TPA: hypothetical protein VND91_04815 [Candidatus Saccharimonadia bacterium]|nr:hypothetical protein [Candidatus Saccharimonadia bacterium]